MESRSSVCTRHKRSKSDCEKAKEDVPHSSDESLQNLKLEMGKAKGLKEKRREPCPVTMAKTSLKKEILQLERHLKDQIQVRGVLEKALGHNSSTTFSSDESSMPKPAKDLIKEIATLELEVMHLEQYLLSLYRKAFDQQIPTRAPTSPHDNPKGMLVRDDSTPNFSSSRSKSIENSRYTLTYEKKDIKVKQVVDMNTEKLTGPGAHRCQSALSHRAVYSSRTSPSDDSLSRALQACHSLPLRYNEVSLANSIICRVAFGKKVKGDFGIILEEFEEIFVSFYFGDFFPVLGYWIDKLNGQIAKMEKNIARLDAIYEEIIWGHLHSNKARDDHEDIVDVLLRSEKDDGLVTMENVKGVLMDIFIAGTQTVSSTLVWAMAELARNPNSMKKAQEEIKLYIKQDQDLIYEEDLHSLEYIKAIVKETLRLHAPVPLLLPRQVMRDCKMEGFDIMENTLVYVNAWAIGRDPRTWDKAEEFIPDRFLNSWIDYKGHDFEFIPFGSGRRICPAMSTGVTVIELALANLLYCFDWVLPCGINREDINMEDAPGISLQKKTPLELLAIKKQ